MVNKPDSITQHISFTFDLYLRIQLPHFPIPRPIPKKMSCVEMCGGVHTAQRHLSTQIPIDVCILEIGLCLGVCLGIGRCECTINHGLSA